MLIVLSSNRWPASPHRLRLLPAGLHPSEQLSMSEKAVDSCKNVQYIVIYGIAPLTGQTIPPGFVSSFLCIHK